MVYAEKGNKVRQINEADAERYVEQGYKITDGRGTVLKDTVPTDLATLRLAYTRLTAENSALKTRVAQLVAEVQELKSKKPAKATAEKEEVPQEEKEEKPTRGKKQPKAEIPE